MVPTPSSSRSPVMGLRCRLLVVFSFHLCVVQGGFFVANKATMAPKTSTAFAALPARTRIPWSAATLLSATSDDDTDTGNSSSDGEKESGPKTDTAPSSEKKKRTVLSPSITSSLTAVASKRDSSRFADNPPKLKKSKSRRWESFDYLQHWYPVIWECDLPVNKPTQVTLFDVDYVVARDGRGGWTALQDRCPHKAAALSEGRITSSGFIQCAYHGWSFNGTTGDCAQIPQATNSKAEGSTSPGGFPARACAKAIPLQVHQGMVWLWPGEVQAIYPTPPTVPEMDLPGWTSIKVVRDFPFVDWSLLMSNILDPDHGLFAHGALAFDYYSASAQHPLDIEETFDNAGWTLTSNVQAVDKLLKVDQEKRKFLGLKVKKHPKKEGPQEDLQATSFFEAPTTAALSRRDANGETKFITAFWVTPVGTGRSRFMSAAISNAFPFQVPRWIFQINLNRFLDQDTLLVASQQPPLLTAEAQGVEKPRSSLFAYGSATDKVVRLIDQFWDATLHKAPNRQLSLQHLYHSGQLQHTPPRKDVLDRQSQHLDICPDSQGFVRKCQLLRKASLAVVAASIVKALWQRAWPTKFRWVPILAAGMAWVSHQLQQQYFFVKTEASRDKDLQQIPRKTWLDPRR